VPLVPSAWRWNGEKYVRNDRVIDRLKHLPKWLIWSLVVWLPLLVAWIPSVMTVASHHDSRSLVVAVGASLGGVAIVATLGFGGSLGYRCAWGYLAWSLLVGIGMVGLFVFVAFENSQPANAPDDPGLGLGAMVVTVALLPVLAFLLGMGGGAGRLIRFLKT
jgi:hypothetical protein